MFSTRVFKSVIAVILLLTITCGLLACNNAKPSEEVFEKAYDKEIDVATERIGKYYDLIDKYDPYNMKIDMSIGVDLSDDLLSLLRSYTAYDLSWLNDANISFSENIKNDIITMVLELAYDKTELVNAELFFDIASGDAFVGIPVLNDVFIKSQALTDDEIAVFKAMSSIDLKSFLPDEKALTSLIKKVYDQAMESIGDVSYEKTELSVNGVKQNCVEYKVNLTLKDVMEIAVDVLEMLEDDNDFKTIVCDFVDAYNGLADKMGVDEIFYTASEVYDETVDSIEVAIDSIKEILNSEDDEDELDEKVLTWTSYVTNDLDVIGTKIKLYVGGETVTFYAATAKNKDDVGTRIYVESYGEKVFEIVGDLVDDGETLSGTYELKIYDESMAFLDLENVDSKKLDEGYFVGSVSLSPSKGFITEVIGATDANASVAGLSLSSLSIKLDVEKNDGKEFKSVLSLMSGSVPYASVEFEAQISDGETVTLPKTTTDDPYEWVEGIDMSALVDKIEKSGLPTYVADLVKVLEEEIESALDSYYGYDYGYEEEDYYIGYSY